MRILALLTLLLAGCVAEGEPCQRSSWSEDTATCVGPQLFQCYCETYDEEGGCADDSGSWTRIELPMYCDCPAYRAGLCMMPVG